MDIVKVLQEELNIKKSQVEATIKLIDEGNTIPFIARYRKEATGSCLLYTSMSISVIQPAPKERSSERFIINPRRRFLKQWKAKAERGTGLNPEAWKAS